MIFPERNGRIISVTPRRGRRDVEKTRFSLPAAAHATGAGSDDQIGAGAGGDQQVLVVHQFGPDHRDLVAPAQDRARGDKVLARAPAQIIDPHVDGAGPGEAFGQFVGRHRSQVLHQFGKGDEAAGQVEDRRDDAAMENPADEIADQLLPHINPDPDIVRGQADDADAEQAMKGHPILVGFPQLVQHVLQVRFLFHLSLFSKLRKHRRVIRCATTLLSLQKVKTSAFQKGNILIEIVVLLSFQLTILNKLLYKVVVNLAYREIPSFLIFSSILIRIMDCFSVGILVGIWHAT